jgi:hypothetical protein
MITYSQEIARGYVYDDPQPYSLDDLDYFTRKVVDDVKKTEQTLFGISLGDIVGDNLDLQPVYKERMRRLQPQDRSVTRGTFHRGEGNRPIWQTTCWQQKVYYPGVAISLFEITGRLNHCSGDFF